MTQATQGAPAPQPSTQPSTQPQAVVGTPAPLPSTGPVKQGRGNTLGSGQEDEGARRQAAMIPGTLSRLRAVAVVVVLVFGALTALQLVLSWNANRTAAADTEQLVRVQGIKTSLLRADALATNAFLIGGLEPAEQRAAYDDAIDQTVRAITAAARAQPHDQDALNALSSAVLDYSGNMELARANNRQGLPVGGAYLRKASADLRSTGLPIVDQLVLANSDRARDSMGSHHPWYVFLPAALAALALYFVNRWIARNFRRRFNTGLVLAAVAVLAVGVVAAFVTNGQRNQNDQLTDGSFQTVVDGATARTAANDAKANESLRLIARGSGQAFEDAWTAASGVVTEALTSSTDLVGLQGAWATYTSQHQQVVDLDSGGQWDQAVALATSTAPGSPSEAFSTFDTALQDRVTASGSSTTDALRSGNTSLLVLAVLAVLAALAAAAFAAVGVNQRLKEYA